MAISCGRNEERSAAPPRKQLVVGFPEGEAASGDQGPGQLTNTLTLEGLTQANDDGRPEPRVAESWEWENDGLRLRVKLRPKVVFHDQTIFSGATAASILKKTVTDPGNRFLYPALNDIADVKAESDDTLIIDLARRSAFLPDDLEVPLNLGSDNKAHIIGTGPYRVVTHTKQEIVLDRFEAYHGGDVSINQVVIQPFSTLRTGWASLLRGELDMVTTVPPDTLQFINNDQVDVYTFSRRYVYTLAFNSKRGPLASPVVRRALNMAVDRDTIVKRIFHGYGNAATGPFWPKHWAYDPSFRGYSYDPVGARRMLDAAGLRVPPNGNSDKLPARLHFRCLLPAGYAVLEDLALTLQKQFNDIGVDMQCDVVPPSDFAARVSAGDFDALVLDINSGPTLTRPYIFWRSAKAGANPYSVFGYEDATTEGLFRSLLAAPNDTSVRSLVRELQKAFIDDPPAVFLAWQDRTRAVRKTFHVVQAPGRDPIFTLWQWKTDNPGKVATRQ